MALAVLLPQVEFSSEELDTISHKLPGKWTWPTAAMLWMIEEGLKVRLIEEFDYNAFVERGSEYLIERFGSEVAKAQAANSDIEREQEIARQFAKHAPIENRIPTIEDISKLIDGGSVVIVNLNAAMLFENTGYSGHFVVICKVEDETITLHDPGLPPSPNLKVSRSIFEKAWGYPSERDKNILAIAS
jgi:hypothetical protein